jgi:hypothetical protein
MRSLRPAVDVPLLSPRGLGRSHASAWVGLGRHMRAPDAIAQPAVGPAAPVRDWAARRLAPTPANTAIDSAS